MFIATPNNPTGLMPDTALLHKLVSLCESRHIHLIVDEAFIDFLPEGSPLTARLPETRYLYLLRSLTKFFAIPGLRLGYLLCGDSHIISNLKAGVSRGLSMVWLRWWVKHCWMMKTISAKHRILLPPSGNTCAMNCGSFRC